MLSINAIFRIVLLQVLNQAAEGLVNLQSTSHHGIEVNDTSTRVFHPSSALSLVTRGTVKLLEGKDKPRHGHLKLHASADAEPPNEGIFQRAINDVKDQLITQVLVFSDDGGSTLALVLILAVFALLATVILVIYWETTARATTASAADQKVTFSSSSAPRERIGRTPQTGTPIDRDREQHFMDMLAQREHQAQMKFARPGSSTSLGGTATAPPSLPAAGSPKNLSPMVSPKRQSPQMSPKTSPHGSPRGSMATPAVPHLCPRLVMHNNEAMFAIPSSQLSSGTGPLQVMGLSGHALLRADVKSDGNGKKLNILMPPAKSPVLASVQMSGGGAFEVSTGKEAFGAIRRAPDGAYWLTLLGSNTPMISFTVDGGGKMSIVAAGSGAEIARSYPAQPNSLDGQDHIEVIVRPGVDGVLVLCCVFAVHLNWNQ